MITRSIRRQAGFLSAFLLLIMTVSIPSLYAQWENIDPPYVDSSWWTLAGVHFTSSNEGWAVGWDYSNFVGILLHYSNGSWTSVTPPYVSSNWGLAGVYFASSTEGWAVGTDGSNSKAVLLHYSNGSWTSVSPPDVGPIISDVWSLFSVNFTSPTKGWAVGGEYRGILLDYSNGFWTSVSLPNVSSFWWLDGVYFTSPTEGWAVGYNAPDQKNSGVLLHYSNGSWTSVTPPYVSSWWWLNGVYFTSPTEGWAVGLDSTNGRGVLLHYSGGMWTSMTPPSVSASWNLSGVHFTSANEGWAVGFDGANGRGVLLHYSGGMWTSMTPPSVSASWDLSGVHFTSANEGWAVGEDASNGKGVLLRYSSAISQYTLSVSKSGTGSGTVTSSPAGINCGSDCNKAYDEGAVVTLTATAAPGSAFTGWSGAGCSGTGTCVLSMDSDKAVIGNFLTETLGLSNKVICGYQGWFNAEGDGSPVDQQASNGGWRHWSTGDRPHPGYQTFELYPDLFEIPESSLFQTGYAHLGNGEPSKLFSSYSNDVIAKHFRWMQDYGIDGIALQRFGSEVRDPLYRYYYYADNRNDITLKVKNAAKTYNKIFYIMYDITGMVQDTTQSQTEFTTVIKNDWEQWLENPAQLDLISSPVYARQNGKPVIAIWGIGFKDRPGTANQFLDLINWFKSKGYYVVGGVPTNWRAGVADSKPGFENVYSSLDMISPWTGGRYSTDEEVDSYRDNFLLPDRNCCMQHGIDYQPVIFPGFAWSNWNGGVRNQIPRRAGNLFWRQAYNIAQAGITSMYIAMFDEYDEATAIAKAAEDSSMIPTDQYFLTLDADGVFLSSDFYLRLAGKATDMLKGLEPKQLRVPIPRIDIANPFDFVKQQYRDFLNRGADAGGLAHWVNQIHSGAMTRAQVIDSFFWSEEFGARIAPIARLYFAYFLRIPDYGGLMYWVNACNSGASLWAVSDSFAGSEEFRQRYGSLSNEGFVNLIYHNILGRSPDSGGYAYWVGELNSGRQTRGQVMVGFSESAEYKSASSNEVFVTMMYVGMLRRSPEQEGFDYWVNYLDSGNSGLALIDGFLNSQEYANRF